MKPIRRIGLWVRSHVSRTLTRLASTIRQLLLWWWQAWVRHRDRLVLEPGYAESLLAILLAALEVFSDNRRTRHLVVEIATAVLTIIRATSPSTWRDGSTDQHGTWSDDPDLGWT